MFDDEKRLKREKLDQTLDKLNDRYGRSTLQLARHMAAENKVENED